jgi:hypothetical protein
MPTGSFGVKIKPLRLRPEAICIAVITFEQPRSNLALFDEFKGFPETKCASLNATEKIVSPMRTMFRDVFGVVFL